jgi:hypothetical protein
MKLEINQGYTTMHGKPVIKIYITRISIRTVYLLVLDRLNERRLGWQDLHAIREKSEIDAKF